ncbi:protein C19orf12 homolog [Ornithodoros turicata]|uniref:Putative conserved plasma membrane protein n=1 Tax=Ornithodoros turicata TaxID=34597 RepID=A0A2R5LIE9_9ACAR
MPINTHELMNVLCQLSEKENLQVTVRECAKGGVIAGISTLVGGVLMGPAGLAIGGAVGGCCAAYLAKGKFLPLATVIRSMSQKERKKLQLAIEAVLRDIDMTDVIKLTMLLANDAAVKRLVLRELVSFFRSQMHLQIID